MKLKTVGGDKRYFVQIYTMATPHSISMLSVYLIVEWEFRLFQLDDTALYIEFTFCIHCVCNGFKTFHYSFYFMENKFEIILNNLSLDRVIIS